MAAIAPTADADDERERRGRQRRPCGVDVARWATRSDRSTRATAAARRSARCRPTRSTGTRCVTRPATSTTVAAVSISSAPHQPRRATACRWSARRWLRIACATTLRTAPSTANASRPHAALSIDAAHSRSARPLCIAREQQHAQPARGAVPLAEDGAGHRGRRGQLQPVDDRRPARGQLQRPQPQPPRAAERGDHVVALRGDRTEADAGRDEHEEEHGDRGDGHRSAIAPEDDQQARSRPRPTARRWRWWPGERSTGAATGWTRRPARRRRPASRRSPAHGPPPTPSPSSPGCRRPAIRRRSASTPPTV